jgi:hypothetical protein
MRDARVRLFRTTGRVVRRPSTLHPLSPPPPEGRLRATSGPPAKCERPPSILASPPTGSSIHVASGPPPPPSPSRRIVHVCHSPSCVADMNIISADTKPNTIIHTAIARSCHAKNRDHSFRAIEAIFKSWVFNQGVWPRTRTVCSHKLLKS